MKFPDVILQQHTAVLGKTGSGKTSTAKLAIEQVVAEGARVCVLDPIKSDWWGLTSSADGKRAGLPFHILGGPRGHVPLHASAGKAVAEIVASGALPLSIIDMADFEPGGQAKFFVDFAPTLLRKMRGVVYLVIEEAHLFAPKERSGVGAENLSIHWAKTLATAGRSKGVRLVLVTQRTQALHNALLGSCDTLIAHRLTAPADQEPVVKWLKANTSKDVLEQVASSLASMKTGEGWICSGEAKIFQRVQFGRISTYDNTATPTSDSDPRDVKTAAVDTDRLRAIIGDAVEKAKADDPRELRKQIGELKRQLAQPSPQPNPKNEPIRQPTVEKPVLTDGDRALLEKVATRLTDLRHVAEIGQQAAFNRAVAGLSTMLKNFEDDVTERLAADVKAFAALLDQKGFAQILGKLSQIPPTTTATARPSPHARREAPAVPQASGSRTARVVPPSNGDGSLPKGERIMLTAVAQYPDGAARDQLSILTGYKRSTRDAYLQRLGDKGFVHVNGNGITATQAGVDALGPDFEPLPTGSALLEWWFQRLPAGERAVLDVLAGAHPDGVDRAAIDERTGFKRSTRDAYIQRLMARRLVEADRGAVKASDELFD